MLSHRSSLFAALRRVRRVALLGVTLLALGWHATAHAEPFAYIADVSKATFSGNLSVVDTATNTKVATVPMEGGPLGVAVTPDGAFVYVTIYNRNTVSVVDTSTNTVVATIPVEAVPEAVAVAPDGHFVYVTNTNSATVSIVATNTNTVVATIPVGTRAAGVAVTPDSHFIYVANGAIDTVSVIAAATNTVVATVPVEDAPLGVTVTPDGAFVYVTNYYSNSVSVIATNTNAVVATIPVEDNPLGVTVTPDGTFVYVTNSNSDTVSVVATAANAVVATVPVGNYPLGVAVTPDGDSVYVTNRDSSTVSVIATATNTVVTTLSLSVQSYTYSFGQFIGPVVCGNGLMGGGEQCDDGNATSGDGCSSTCSIEPGYSCSGTPSVCQLSNRAPVAQCHNVTVSTASNTCAVASASIDNGSSDPDGDQLTVTQNPTGPYPVGNTQVTLTVSDGFLSSQCSGTITVSDGQAPAISCPASQTATATVGGTTVRFSPTASDNCGTVMTSCSPASGATFPLGTTPVTCTATDGAGIQHSCSFNVRVQYPFTGFFQPVDNLPTVNQVKGGQTIQVKFSLGGDFGLGILAAGSPTSQIVACSSSAPVDDVEEVTTSNSGLTYDATSNQYAHAWKTQKAWAGQCRQFMLTLTDGTSHVANFQFK